MKSADKKRYLKTVRGWNIKTNPEYRSFRCANCQKHLHKAWHIWFDHEGYKCEIHLCQKCYSKKQ